MDKYMNFGFLEQIREEYVDRGLLLHELVNWTSFPGWTNCRSFVDDHWEARYVDPHMFHFEIEMLVYNDVCALFTERGGDLFGAEIRNSELASMQRQLYDLLWEKASRFRVVSEGGKGELLRKGSARSS